MGHLPADASLADYNTLIQMVVQDPQARVFVYRVRDSDYVVARGYAIGRASLIIFSLTGLMETRFRRMILTPTWPNRALPRSAPSRSCWHERTRIGD